MANKTPWKPPMWLIALDLAGLALLFLGLSMHYTPDGALVQSLPPTLRIPFLIVGSALMAMGSFMAIRQVLAHRRS